VEITLEESKAIRSLFAAMDAEMQPMRKHWADLARAYLPRRYTYLETPGTPPNLARNPTILNGTGTKAARDLASGMMNGITSPSRKWFRMWPGNKPVLRDRRLKAWLAEVEDVMMFAMSQSNFYKALAVMYLDLAIFGTAAMLIYEDSETIIHAYNPALGEFRLMQDHRQRVVGIAREFYMQVRQVVDQFGEENCSTRVREAYKRGGGSWLQPVKVRHLIEPNTPPRSGMSKSFRWREWFWEADGGDREQVLRVGGFHEFPGACPRWELSGNYVYGGSPGMDALGDVLQLQQETLVKAKGLEKGVDPALLADVSLQNTKISASPSGITFVPGLARGQAGVVPVAPVNMPLGELTLDIREVENRIRDTFHNDLFRMIANLDTVRSATEIDARREEKLVLLGPVLERFENEALDPALARIFNICYRAGLIPPPPEGFEDVPITIQYTSLLATAQRASNTVATERLFGLIGNLAAVYPEVRHVPRVAELLVSYADSIGVPADGINSPEEVEKAKQEEAKAAQAAKTTEEVGVAVEGAKTLSETDVGGGMNALEALMGGG